ncbi:MAG TPA: NAD(+)/NADH kinase [Polyangiaceae bacterium]|nr:NAD(+)/NADH kinase [Polyangiaceae bacterium]
MTKIFVVAKRTAHRLYGHHANVKKLVARKDIAVARMRRAHDDHEATLQEVRAAIKTLGAHATYYDGSRSKLRGKADLVVTVGGDGTLLGASHQIAHDTPVLGINSAPADSVGFFCGGQKGRVLEAIRGALSGTMPRVELARMRVECNDKLVHDRVLNEALFCHELPAGTSRYILRVHDAHGGVAVEEQKSSGVWVGPAAGSTAAQRSAGGRVLPLTSRRLQFVVREAYVPRGEKLRLLRGVIEDGGALDIHCKMRVAKIFIDGTHIVADAGLGDVLRMTRSPQNLVVLGLKAGR